MHIPPAIVPLIASILVYIDARTIGIKKGILPGFFNMGAGMWALACFLFLIIGLPLYFFKRGQYVRAIVDLKAQGVQQAMIQAQEAAPGVWPPPPQAPPGEN